MKTNELIERLRNIVPHCWSKIRKKLDDIADEISDTLETQQKRIAELEAERRWIPVTERLPEDDEDIHFYDDGRLRFCSVLAYQKVRGAVRMNRLCVRPCGITYLDQQVTDGWIWSGEESGITHWIPLPEPPKEV